MFFVIDFFCCPYQSYIWFVLACLTAILGLCEWLWSFDTTTILIDFILVNSSDSSKGSLQDRIIVWLLITVKEKELQDSYWDFFAKEFSILKTRVHEIHKSWTFADLSFYLCLGFFFNKTSKIPSDWSKKFVKK